jgi:hypothetical protein
MYETEDDQAQVEYSVAERSRGRVLSARKLAVVAELRAAGHPAQSSPMCR